METERRSPLTVRTTRIAGGTAGAMIAVIIAWAWNEHTGHQMTPEVSAAIGGLASTCIICLKDLQAFVLAIHHQRRR